MRRTRRCSIMPRFLTGIFLAGWLVLAGAGRTSGQEVMNGDLDKSGAIDAADEATLRNWLAGNLARIPGQAGQVYQVNPIVGNLRFVPAGTFTQGSPADEPCRETRETQFTHTLTRNLAVMETEVTRLMWAYLKGVQPGLPADPSWAMSCTAPTVPVQQVSWYEAVLFANLLSQACGLRPCYYSDAGLNWPIDEGDYTSGPFFCDWDAGGYRLLSEGEWEYCCRAGTATPFWVGEPAYTASNCALNTAGLFPQLELAAWFYANSDATTNPAGWKAANPWGLKDVHGNVEEWCWDWYGPSPGGSVSDYRGAASGVSRVCRGGSYCESQADCRSAFRSWEGPDIPWYNIGFRLARTVSAAELANPAGRETMMGDLDKSGAIHAADAVILRNCLAGNLGRIPGQAGQVCQVDPLAGNLRFIPAGTFNQGSPAGEPCRNFAETQFTHTLTKNLAVMETEVTRLMWAYLKGVQPDLPADPSDPATSPAATAPVQNCTWYDAVLFANLLSRQYGLRACYYSDAALIWPIDADDYTTGPFYCDWTAGGYRLLSEGEWEYACRAGTTTPFWIAEPDYTAGNCGSPSTPGLYPQLELAAWLAANAGGTAQPAGWKAANPWGLKDVHGNVMEWCWDWYGTYPVIIPGGSEYDYRGAASGSDRVVRGGAWSCGASLCRSADRYSVGPGGRGISLGFRLVRTLP